MTKPKMILFDYGHTLVHESNLNALRGTAELLKYATKNINNLSPEAVNQFSAKLFEEMGKAREAGLELHNHMHQRFVYEYLGIEFPLTQDEMEDIFWDHFAPGLAMPHIGDLLDYLHAQGISTGVISNISFSGGALKRRLDRLLAGHHFAFIIATSEYIIRKPNPMIFELALRKAGIHPWDAWYCGDSPAYDVLGAASAGIYPVLYDCGFERPYFSPPVAPPDFPFTSIGDWLELIPLLESL